MAPTLGTSECGADLELNPACRSAAIADVIGVDSGVSVIADSAFDAKRIEAKRNRMFQGFIQPAEQNLFARAFETMDGNYETACRYERQATWLVETGACQVKKTEVGALGTDAFKEIEAEFFAGNRTGKPRCSAFDSPAMGCYDRAFRRGAEQIGDSKISPFQVTLTDVRKTEISVGRDRLSRHVLKGLFPHSRALRRHFSLAPRMAAIAAAFDVRSFGHSVFHRWADRPIELCIVPASLVIERAQSVLSITSQGRGPFHEVGHVARTPSIPFAVFRSLPVHAGQHALAGMKAGYHAHARRHTPGVQGGLQPWPGSRLTANGRTPKVLVPHGRFVDADDFETV